LFENPNASDRINHSGVEVATRQELNTAIERISAAGLADKLEEQTTCCHATQNKVRSAEPDGIAWKWYRVTDDAPAKRTPGCE
jgi:hypothetical protein